MLERKQFSVVCAADGAEALAARKAQHFNIALLDVQMPRMDGIECVRRLRHWEKGRGEKGGRRHQLTIAALGQLSGRGSARVRRGGHGRLPRQARHRDRPRGDARAPPPLGSPPVGADVRRSQRGAAAEARALGRREPRVGGGARRARSGCAPGAVAASDSDLPPAKRAGGENHLREPPPSFSSGISDLAVLDENAGRDGKFWYAL